MKLFNRFLWRGMSIATILLTGLSVTLSSVANEYDTLINSALNIETSKIITDNNEASQKKNYFPSAYRNLQEMYRAKVQLLREIGQEGVILLKNRENTLPLSSGKIALLGAENLIYATNQNGGDQAGGSIDRVTLSQCTTLEQALRSAGFEVSIGESNLSESDAAIVAIGRVGGEGSDLSSDALSLTDEEKSLLNKAKASTANKVIVLVSGDFSPEISELETDARIGAILKFGNAGYRGMYGVADVIGGAVSPSGKLVETMAKDADSAPAMQNFGDYSYTNGSSILASQAKNYVVYMEGIYQDYKYYETRYEDCVLKLGNASSTKGSSTSEGWKYSGEVLYGFGYGLSYTTFSKRLIGEPEFDADKKTATVRVEVTNTGKRSGKEVVQVYGQSPYTSYDKENRIEKSAVQLLGYEKTELLQPGDTNTVSVKIPLQWLASYDAYGAKTYIMDAGKYFLSVGDGAHDALNNILAAKGKKTSDGMDAPGNADLTYSWEEKSFDSVTYSKSVYTGEKITNAFEDADINYWVEDPVTYLSRSDWATTFPVTQKLKASQNMISSLNDTKKYENGVWNDAASRIEVKEVKYIDDETGGTLNTLTNPLSVAFMRGEKYDSSAWNEILDRLTIYEMSHLVSQGRISIQACPSISFPESSGSDSPVGLNTKYLYSEIDPVTAEKTSINKEYLVTDGITEETVNLADMTPGMYSSEPVLAATFNSALARRQGEMFGEDGLYAGKSFTWGLGANLHRTPCGGRATEYFSADPVQTSIVGAAETLGAKSKGHILVVKHFVANEQEQNRIGVATFMNEQNLRENYLRSFEGIMTFGEAQGIMASYNRVGLIGAPAEYDLMTTILRKEWGSEAYSITDLNGPTPGLYDGNAGLVAGTNMMMNNGSYDKTSGSYVNRTLSPANIKNDPILLTAVREACHRIIYTFVNSMAMNGISSSSRIVYVTPWWKPTLTALEITFGLAALGSVALLMISTNRKEKKKQ